MHGSSQLNMMLLNLTVIGVIKAFLITAVWSLGCVLHAILTLQNPYKGVDEKTMLQNGERPNINHFISEDLQRKVKLVPKKYHEDRVWKSLCNVFFRCTQSTPDSRPSTGQLLEMLERIEKGEDITKPEG